MSLAFSSAAEDAMTRTAVVSDGVSEHKNRPLSAVYHLNECCLWIARNGFQTIALQFPDSLLGDAADIYKVLSKETGRKFFILGDTTYGSCCVDEIAAEHAKCDSIIHFGPSCLSPSSRLPVALVFPVAEDFDAEDCCTQIRRLMETQKEAIILYDTEYFPVLEKLKDLQDVTFSQIIVPENQSVIADGTSLSRFTAGMTPEVFLPANTKRTCCGRRFFPSLVPEDLLSRTFVYIGRESPCMFNLFIHLPGPGSFFRYDPKRKILAPEALQVNRRIMRRYYLIERAKDAKIVGILVGTLGVKDYMEIIERLKTAIKLAGKRFYTFVMGKPNPAKLANFMEVDVFVYVACPESHFDSKEYLKPVVTPHEMEIACGYGAIDERFVPDFRELLPGGNAFVEFDERDHSSPDVSLISGAARVMPGKEVFPEVSKDMILRTNNMSVSSTAPFASDLLASRSWQGLDPRYGEDTAGDIVEGRHGIAASYGGEQLGIVRKMDVGQNCPVSCCESSAQCFKSIVS